MASAIKDFFKKKKADAKFKVAGSGHKLGDSSSSSREAAEQAARARAQQQHPQERQLPSKGAQQAGAAALNRIAAQEKQSTDFVKNRQRALIKEQARKELERERQTDEEIAKLQAVYGEREPELLEAPSALGSRGIFFKCSLLGEDLKLPRDEMRAKIRDFLYSQLEEEKGLTAVLIIHTCNTNRDKVQVCLETLSKYFDNILQNPTEEKFRKIRKTNKAFQERVGNLEGTEDFLLGSGFIIKQFEGPDGTPDDFYYFPEEADIEHLIMMKESLMSAEPLRAELDRGVTILPPSEKATGFARLTNDFFVISADEVKKEQRERTDVLERESMLRTKAMREKEAAAGRKRYKYCLVRIRFPDGYSLQGTFSVYENINAVQEFVQEHLEIPLPFQLKDSVTGVKLKSEEKSLQELGLVPASVLVFSWHPEIEADLGEEAAVYLKQNLKE